MTERSSVQVDGLELSVLGSGTGTPQLLLLHGTFWSRVWQPVLAALGRSVTAAAIDFPGFGHSEGELNDERAGVPELAALTLRVADALGMERFTVVGHDIGGAVAQHLAARHADRVPRLVLVNSVLYDSWPVPAVSRFRDPSVRASTTADEFRHGRADALAKAVTRRLDDHETTEYLSPWRDGRRIRSWMALAAAADARYTTELVPALREAAPPTLLIWGEEDEFQPIAYARRFADEMPAAALACVPGARHIPMEDDPERVAAEMLAFFELLAVTESL
jgi:pimeloyl-ACP methyl ester carboxylesterase